MLIVGAAALVGAGGCGGGTAQDAKEPEGNFTVDVDAKFPPKQHIAGSEAFTLRVSNTDSKAIPNVAVTIDTFTSRSKRQDLADPERPVWIVDRAPTGGDTAYLNTWALGRLAAGKSKTFTWHVTAIRAGTHTVKYRVAAGLNGKAKAQLDGGQVPEGSFTVAISRKPPQATVDPATGKVVRDGESR